jgi:hypothetical protein
MKYILESIPFSSKIGWVAETVPMFKREAEALLKARLAYSGRVRRYRIIKS